MSPTTTETKEEEKVPTPTTKSPSTIKTATRKSAEIFLNKEFDPPFKFDENNFNFDECSITEVIKFLQKLAKNPEASETNKAFTQHITDSLMKMREDKLKMKASIPEKLDDGWEPIIKVKIDNFDCNALCDLGASTSVMPKQIYDMLELPPLEKCYLSDHHLGIIKEKPLGKVSDVLIMVNNNFVPVDFIVLDIKCNASCPIILGRPFLRTTGAIIDMRVGNIRYQFPLKKGMEHFPRKRKKTSFDFITRTSYEVDASSFENT